MVEATQIAVQRTVSPSENDLMLLALLLIQSTAEIVVTGQRLAQAYEVCVRRRCTPADDARISIAMAEAEFRNGRYVDAKRTLAGAIRRNKSAAHSAPRPVAAIYEAYATVALHDGDERAYRSGVSGQVKTLRDNLPSNDPAVMAVSTALGDMWVKLGRYVEADGVYAAAQRAATAAGEPRAALLIAFRRVSVAVALGGESRAIRLLDQIDADPATADPEMRKVARILRSQVIARRADDATMAQLATGVAQAQGAAPALLWSPPYRDNSTGAINAENLRFSLINTIVNVGSDLAPLQWIDVGFWIRPDGRTDQVEVLRSSRSAPWASTVLAQISARRYAASSTGEAAVSGAVGNYRIERVTKRTQYATPIRSLVPRRLPAAGFETIDLTDGDSRANAAGVPTSR